MKQVIKKSLKKPLKEANKIKKADKTKPIVTHQRTKHQEYGTSKLEEDFARDFLDKLGIKYIYQFEAPDIGRFYDFYLTDSQIIIEVDGDYYHGKGLMYEEMSPMQKKNHRVDELKDHWALIHGYPLIRIWEHDIRHNPSEVMKMLKERLYIQEEKIRKINNKNKRHG